MDDKQLIKNWHAHQFVEEDYFSKYVFEYLAFIGFLKRVKFINNDGDSGAIQELKRDDTTREKYLQRVQNVEELRTSWTNIQEELDPRPLGLVEDGGWGVRPIWYWACSCENVENRRTHVCEEQGKIRSLEDWENMVEYWHSIRNNLFHGSKNPQDNRDQILVENGYITLRPLVEIFVEEQNANE